MTYNLISEVHNEMFDDDFEILKNLEKEFECLKILNEDDIAFVNAEEEWDDDHYDNIQVGISGSYEEIYYILDVLQDVFGFKFKEAK